MIEAAVEFLFSTFNRLEMAYGVILCIHSFVTLCSTIMHWKSVAITML